MKRSPGAPLLSLDFAGAEGELTREGPSNGQSLEQYFHHEWVRSLFGVAVDKLKAECEARGKAVAFQLFERYELEPHPDERLTYQALADAFGVPVTQVTNLLAFARRELQRTVLATLREVTVSEGEFREEARRLFGVQP